MTCDMSGGIKLVRMLGWDVGIDLMISHSVFDLKPVCMRRLCQGIPAGLLLASLWFDPAAAQVVNGDFSGGATGWTSTNPTDSTLTYTGNQLTATSDDDGTGTNSRTYASQAITVADPGFLSYLLVQYSSTDIGNWDYPTVLIDGTFYWITTAGALTTTASTGIDNDDATINNVSGATTLATGAHTIGFGVTAVDSQLGPGIAIWDDIEFQELTQSPGAQSVDEDAVLTFSGGSALQVATNSGAASISVTLTVTDGIVTLGTTAGITITGGGNGTATVTFNGTPAAVNTALAGTTYTPDPDYNGAATLTFFANGGGTSDTDTVAITVNSVPDYSFTITKVADLATVTAAGQVITYTITVDNTGDSNLTTTSISDTLVQNGIPTVLTVTGPTGDGGTVGEMEPTETWVYTATHTVTQAQIDDENDLVNTATFDAAELSADSDSATTTIPLPVLTLVKTVTNGPANDTDWDLTFSGPSNGTGAEGAAAITSVAVPVGTYTLSETNVSAAANYALGELSCSGSADTSTTPLSPTVTLTYGETVTCTFENRRGRTITLLKDTVGGLAVDTDWTLSAVSTLINKSGSEGDNSITNTGARNQQITLSETGPAGYVLTGLGCVGTADTGTTVANPLISVANGEHAFCTFTNTFDGSFTIQKDVDATNTSTLNTLTYTITVTNTGTADLTSPVLTDTLLQNGGALALTTGPTLNSGDTDTDGVFDVGEIWVYGATYDVTQANLDDGNDIVNDASFSTAELSVQSDDATTTITTNPSISVTKSADDTTDVTLGQVITYTYVVTNNGNQTISNIDLADVHGGSGPAPTPGSEAISNDVAPLLDWADASTDGIWDSLPPGDSVTFTGTYTITQNDIDTKQ